MKNAPIRLIIILGSLTLTGIIFSQIFWVSKAVKSQERQFNHNVQMALRNVVESLCEINGNDIASDPIDQISSNYFIARTNYSINISSLEYLIKAEFEKRSLKEDFEYGVYSCLTESMVYGNFVSFGDEAIKPMSKLPNLYGEDYYFGVYFPNKSSGLVNELGFWKYTSLITILITIFFGYAMFVILKQKRLSEIQKDFINNMTHEFKTPLATLLLSSEVLKEEANSNRGRKYADIIKSESLRLQGHITRFLETTSVGYSKRNVKKEVFVNQIITDVITRFETHLKSVELDLCNEKALIVGDPDILEKILFNLIENAMKYGGNWVQVETKTEEKNVKIIITNDGDIPHSEHKKVFRKFYRITEGDRHDVSGFGLGLFFVKNAIRSFRGKVTIDCKEGLTSFILTIPRG